MTEEQKEKSFKEHLKAEYHDCFQVLKGKLPPVLAAQTAEIAAATLVYQQLRENGWSREFLDYLLRFHDPLEMAKDLYLEEPASPYTEESFQLFGDMPDSQKRRRQEVMVC